MDTRPKTTLRGFSLVIILIMLVTILPFRSWAAEKYPSRPITLVVGNPAGTMGDAITRLWVPYLQKYLGVPVVVENRGGGGGVIGCNYVANAKPDGYTIANFGNHIITAVLMGQAAYSFPGDLRVVAHLHQFTDGFGVKADSEWKTLQEFMDYTRKNPGVVKYGSTGVGGTPHLRMEYFLKYAKVNIVHLPFKSGADLVTALLGGHVPLAIYSVASLKPHIDAGKLRMLFCFEPPAEFGLDPTIPHFLSVFGTEALIDSSTYMVVPGKTPVEIIKVLEGCVEKMMKEPAYLAELKNLYIRPKFIDGNTFMQKILPEKTAQFKAVLQTAGVIK